ncbi:MAG: TonB-dependent receptor plug domain-containing protein [Caulobacteraceae bacterium]
MLHSILFALATADGAEASAAPPKVEGVVVTAQRAVGGDLQKGTLAYKPEFFVAIRPASALDMVNWLPGFVFEDTRDMRGLEGSTGNVLIDGKPPTSKTDTLTSVLKRLPADQVERVDLIVGGAPGVDMHGRNVIANVVLKKRDKALQVVTAATYVDTHGRANPDLLFTHSDKDRDRTLEVSLQITRNNAIYPAYGYGPWVRRDGSGAVQFAADERFEVDGPYVAGNASYEFPLAGGRLRVNGLGRYIGQILDERDVLTVGGPGRYGLHDDDPYRQGELGLRYEHAFGRLTLEAQALERYTGWEINETIDRPPQPSANQVETRNLESVQRLVLRYKPDATLTVEGSAEHAFNDAFTHTAVTANGLPVVVPVATTDVTEDRWEAGGLVTWKPNGQFSLDAALKAEVSGLASIGDIVLSRQLAYAKPRLAVAWSPDKDDQLRLRLEHEVGQIPFGAFVTFNEYESGRLRNANADIRPQRAWVAEAVAERHFWGTGDLTVTARYRALEDVLEVAPRFDASGAGYQISANIGGGRESDLIGNLMVPLKRFGLGASTVRAIVTWRRGRVTDPVSGQPRALSGLSELQEELHFAQDLPRWKINWGVDAFYLGGATLYRPFGNEAVDAWPHVNVFVERRFEGEMTLRVELQNLPGAAPKNIISVFSGLRDRSTLLYYDDKRLSVGPLLYLRLRKTL